MNYNPIPTVVPLPRWDIESATVEAKMLLSALNSCDASYIIQLLSQRDSTQRTHLREAYEKEYNRDLVKDLKSEFQGDFSLLAAGLVMKPLEYVAKRFYKSLGRTSLNVKTLAEILALRPFEEITELKKIYQKNFNLDPSKQVLAETSGNLRTLLLYLLDRKRDEGSVDTKDANRRAVEFMAILEVTPEKFEDYFINLITKENIPMLRVIFYEFEKLNSDLHLDRLIELKYNGDLRIAVKTVVDLVRNAPQYYAGRLFKAMEGWVVDNATLMLVITCRCEIDLGNIKSEYKRQYNRELSKDIKGRTTGDYRRLLLALAGKEKL